MASEYFCRPGILTRVELNLRQLINNVELNDVTFICEDGLRVHGCRVLLAAGSAFFKRLLVGEMLEARDSNVPLPTVPSSVLILVMKFLYTEKLLPEDLDPSVSTDSTSSIQGDHPSPPLDWNFLLKVIGTARFLMLDNLEKVIIDQLRKDIPDRNNMLEEDALIQILTWCAASGGPGTSGSLDRTCLPGPEVTMKYIQSKRRIVSLDDSARVEFDFSRGRVDFLHRITKESLKPVLPFADFTLIHSELQSSVIKPILSHVI
ncbi:hypothetical protein R1sor_014397 [Riccia sorocarpa]|uniref:BTB domain-containing protein n=1 Tax=Riccia sorocarpa TaxID=122646 RepID=A0ABD3H9S9_9MARC